MAHASGSVSVSVGGGPDLTDVSENIVHSVKYVPGLLSGIAYILGLLLGVMGVLKLKAHVESPTQTHLREAIGRFVAGGALFALPILYEAMKNTIDGGPGGFWGGILIAIGAGGITVGAGSTSVSIGAAGGNTGFNELLGNIIYSIGGVPGLVSAVSYLLALLFGVSGILKIREHIDDPERTPMREPVTRFLTGGALLALPFVFDVFQTTIDGGSTSGGIVGMILGIVDAIAGLLGGGSGGGGCSQASGLGINVHAGPINVSALLGGGDGGNGPTVGSVICNSYTNSSRLADFLPAVSYLFGVILGVWAILKFKEYVLKPDQISIWEGVSRMLAAGCFFALPFLVTVAEDTIGLFDPMANSGFGAGAGTGSGLDAMMTKFMSDIYGPMLFVLDFFGYIAGTVLLMIAISRLMKSAQEGPRGPGGLGTMFTFLAAGALISLSPMISSFTTSLFNAGDTATQAQISYLDPEAVTHVIPVVEAVLQFMIVLGVVSFARGIFIIREVAEGHGQASMMAGMTHLIGGALAINLGPLMNAVQATLGLDPTQVGVNFL